MIEWPHLHREIATVGCDADALVRRGDLPEGRAVPVDRMDDAARGEQVRERNGEGSSATTEIRPRCWPKLSNSTAREHLGRIMQPHARIMMRTSRAIVQA